jgi:hypothetical protein
LSRLVRSVALAATLALAFATPALAAESKCQEIPPTNLGAIVPAGTFHLDYYGDQVMVCEDGSWRYATPVEIFIHGLPPLIAIELAISAVTAIAVSAIKRDRNARAWLPGTAIVIGVHIVGSVVAGLAASAVADFAGSGAAGGVAALGLGALIAFWYERTRTGPTMASINTSRDGAWRQGLPPDPVSAALPVTSTGTDRDPYDPWRRASPEPSRGPEQPPVGIA